ncbi:MAG: peptidylprolyl isomerase [Verrucomicrobia bacterium]|nr:peptidylprolyl isomerase [Verrucomicrobiota bacterium]
MRASCFLVVSFLAVTAFAGPVIDPIPNANIPAGKSLTLPVTASSPEGRPLTYTVTSSTNRITVEVHTNNPYWKMSVAQVAPSNAPSAFLTPLRGGLAMVTNVGDLTFMLLRDRAPRTVDAIQGFTAGGLYTSNTILHRIVASPFAIIQGGDPGTNGMGGPVFRLDDEFHPRALFSGNGQLAMANSGKDTAGSQFFATQGPQRNFDFRYTICGQLLRGFNVLSNLINTPTGTNNRPLADVIITRASLVPNPFDTVITLTGTNLAGVSGVIQIVADDGLGGRATNVFTATTVADTGFNAQPIIYPTVITNLVAPLNGRLTNIFSAVDPEGDPGYWFLSPVANATNSFNSIRPNGDLQVVIVPDSNYVGTVNLSVYVSSSALWGLFPTLFPYDVQDYQFSIGDTPIAAAPASLVAPPLKEFTGQLLATFTNGVPNSPPGYFSASINWGDNSISSGTITADASGRKAVRGSHTYTNSGDYPVYVTIKSASGAEATVRASAQIQPHLSIARHGGQYLLRWPAWATEYQVQSHTNLATPDWLTLTNPPALNGYDQVLTYTNAASREFFRLKR